VPQMGRKQRLNARSDKRAPEAKSKAATKFRKMRVRFAAEVEIIYFEAEPSQAGPSNEAPPAPTDPEVPAELTDVSETAELWALSDEGSAEADAELRRRHEESSRWLQEHLDRLHGPRRERPAAGSWQEKMELDEAMDMYRRANMLDNEDERGPGFRWLSRGWKCYAFEAGACEPVLTWATSARASATRMTRPGAPSSAASRGITSRCVATCTLAPTAATEATQRSASPSRTSASSQPTRITSVGTPGARGAGAWRTHQSAPAAAGSGLLGCPTDCLCTRMPGRCCVDTSSVKSVRELCMSCRCRLRRNSELPVGISRVHLRVRLSSWVF